jgi:hypothetical protein
MLRYHLVSVEEILVERCIFHFIEDITDVVTIIILVDITTVVLDIFQFRQGIITIEEITIMEMCLRSLGEDPHITIIETEEVDLISTTNIEGIYINGV